MVGEMSLITVASPLVKALLWPLTLIHAVPTCRPVDLVVIWREATVSRVHKHMIVLRTAMLERVVIEM